MSRQLTVDPDTTVDLSSTPINLLPHFTLTSRVMLSCLILMICLVMCSGYNDVLSKDMSPRA